MSARVRAECVYAHAYTNTHSHTIAHSLTYSLALTHTFLLSPENDFGIFALRVFQRVRALQFTLDHVPIPIIKIQSVCVCVCVCVCLACAHTCIIIHLWALTLDHVLIICACTHIHFTPTLYKRVCVCAGITFVCIYVRLCVDERNRLRV